MNIYQLMRRIHAGSGRVVTAGRLNLRNLGATVIAPLVPRLIIIPRSRNAIFDPVNSEEFRDLLPDYLSFNLLWNPIRAIELRFYIDIATRQAGTYWARRRLTVILLSADGTPVANRRVEWTRTTGSAHLRFVDSVGNLQQQLTGASAVQTDANGMAEVIIAHPARTVAAADTRLTIRASSGSDQYEIILTITRNNAVTRLDDIARQTLAEADPIWVYQPDRNHRSGPNQGIENLQEIINEVVSRHRRIRCFNFVPLDGIFNNRMRRALRQYLTSFPNIRAGRDYPYDLRNINVSQHLRNYIRTEYSPFNPNLAANRGWIVDRRLLIGDRWSLDPRQIDGLWELKRAVVYTLKREMERTANDYITCSTFWLHRPIIHRPYQPVPSWVFRVTANNVALKTAPNPASANLTDGAGNPIAAVAGELFPSPNPPAGAWIQIAHPAHPAGNGWVPLNSGRRVRNDQSLVVNHGTLGRVVGGIDYSNGVAYSYGCKDLPARYINRLNTNPHAPPADAGGNRRRIAHWNEYANRHKVGRRRGDGPGAPQNNQGPNRIAYHTGCDCGGLVQNCITEAQLTNGMRIVPNALTRAIGFGAAWEPDFPLRAIGAGSFIGGRNRPARRVPRPARDPQRQWVRFGDLISGPGHIVWVAEDFPARNRRILNNGNTFHIYQEKGNHRYYLRNGARAPIDNTRFLRKAVRSPFHYESIAFANWRVGKVYIWR